MNLDGNNNNSAVRVGLDKFTGTKNITVRVKFYSFCYENITVASSHSNTGRFILNAIRFTSSLILTGTKNVLIISDNVVLTGKWENKVSYSTFGSIFLGKGGSRMKFMFTGTRLAVLTSSNFGSNY